MSDISEITTVSNQKKKARYKTTHASDYYRSNQEKKMFNTG